MGRLLDSYDRRQAAPFGSLSDSNPGMRQLKSQRGAITSALRQGISNARRKGDTGGLLAQLGVANAYGLQATGIGSAELRVAGDEEYAVNTEKQAAMNADLANRAAEGANRIGNAPQEEIGTDKTGGPTATANPGAKAGAGNGTPLKQDDPGSSFAARATQESAPRPSFDDQEKAAQRRVSLEGGFGTVAKASAEKAVAAETLLARRVDPETGDINPLDDAEDVASAVKMGSTEASFRGAIQRQSDKIKRKLGKI